MRGLCIAALVVILAGGAEGAADPATPVPGAIVARAVATSQVLRNRDAKPFVRVPLFLKPGLGPVTAAVESVAVEGVADPALLSAIVATPAVTDALLLSVDRAAVERPAEYDVTVLLRAAADAPVAETITVRIVVERATLRAIAPLVIERRLGWLGDDEPMTPRAIELLNTAAHSDLVPLAISQPGAATHGEAPITARLVATAPETVSAGRSATVPLSVSGRFPPGSSRGTIEIRAPQLAEPVVVAYELRAAYSAWWIIPIFLVAAILGWFLRIHLRRREALHAAQVRAASLRLQLAAEAARNPTDPGIALEEHLAALATPPRKVEELTAVIAAADEALTRAIAARAARQAELLSEVTAQTALLTGRWRLPARVDLSRIAARLAAARQALLVGDVKLGAATVAGARALLVEAGDGVEAWMKAAAPALERLARGKPMPETLRSERAADFDALGAALRAIPAWRPEPPPLRDWLNTTHTAASFAEDVAARLAAGIARLAAALADELADAAARAPLAELAARSSHPDPRQSAQALAGLGDVLDALDRTVREAVSRLYPAKADSVQATLDEGRYLAAVRAAKVVGKVAGKDGAAVVSDDAARGSGAATERALEVTEVTTAAEGAIAVLTPAPRAAEAILAEAGRKLWFDRLLVGVTAAVLTSLAAWFFYKDAWVGTTKDVVGVAVVAFMSDFSAASLIAWLEKLGTRSG